MKPPSQPLVSVIIPTLNAGSQLTDLVEAIKAQQVQGPIEIVVIDSQSRDGTLKRAQEAGATVLSVSRRHFNHGRTRNQAIAASTGEFAALTVQDALPADDKWLAHLLEPLLEQPDVAGSYGLQLASPTCGPLARIRSSLWCERHTLPGYRAIESPDRFQELSPEERIDLIRFDNVTSCIRRSLWRKIPLPGRNYGEDMGWAKEVLLAGYRIAYAPSAQVWHCHERGWLHDLRRAYIDGYARADLVAWPCPPMAFGDAVAVLRRIAFFLHTRRFDSIVDPGEMRRFLFLEHLQYDPLESSIPAQVYVSVLKFTQVLLDKASSLLPEGMLPERTWGDLLRFASVSVGGQNLGAATAYTRGQGPARVRFGWNALHWFLDRGV